MTLAPRPAGSRAASRQVRLVDLELGEERHGLDVAAAHQRLRSSEDRHDRC